MLEALKPFAKLKPVSWSLAHDIYHISTDDITAARAAIEGATEPANTQTGEMMNFDLEKHLTRQMEFSAKTFGPGKRTAGVIDHIRKELQEIEADPDDIMEWVDVIILAFDGAWRAGWRPSEIIKAIVAKQDKNESREWPDWRTAPEDRAIEHVRK